MELSFSEPLSGLNLATGNYYDFSHGTTWSPAAAGTYDIEVWALILMDQQI